MNDPESVQLFNAMHTRNREDDEYRYNLAKEVVHKTVEASGAITLTKSYSKADVEMVSANDEDSYVKYDRQSESADNIEDLKYKMAVGRGTAIRQSAKSPTAQLQASAPPKKQNLIPKPVPTQTLADVQP